MQPDQPRQRKPRKPYRPLIPPCQPGHFRLPEPNLIMPPPPNILVILITFPMRHNCAYFPPLHDFRSNPARKDSISKPRPGRCEVPGMGPAGRIRPISSNPDTITGMASLPGSIGLLQNYSAIAPNARRHAPPGTARAPVRGTTGRLGCAPGCGCALPRPQSVVAVAHRVQQCLPHDPLMEGRHIPHWANPRGSPRKSLDRERQIAEENGRSRCVKPLQAPPPTPTFARVA